MSPSSWTPGALLIVLALAALAGGAGAAPPDASWEVASRGEADGAPLVIYVEAERTPDRPAFRIETTFPVPPHVAAETLMRGMIGARDLPRGHTRRVLERSEREALVYTYIDLPFMLSDRELALRIKHTSDEQTGIHRVAWVDENGVLPPPERRVTRLEDTAGYWEFRPDGSGGTSATYMTRSDTGGTIPAAIGHRMMRSQAVDAVARLRRRLDEQRRTQVAAPPPSGLSLQE